VSSGYVVLLDLEGAGYKATKHLIEHGHLRIGLITYSFDIANVHPVNLGYERALREAGIEVYPHLTARVKGFDSNAGAEGARMLMAEKQPPTAIFAITDFMAIGAICALQQIGLRIPQDIAIAGFNDIAQASYINPPLTTVATPAFQMGQEAMKMLKSLIASKRPAHKRVLLPTSLVIRQSCGDHELPYH
jgi:DNA-binding LacI/PurR family transcriptional regulator